MSPLNAESLKLALWETLQALKADKILPNRAEAIATQAREILRTVKVQMQIVGHSKQAVPDEVMNFAGPRTIVVQPRGRIAAAPKRVRTSGKK